MEVIEVDVLNAEPLQGLFKGGPDIFRLAIRSVRSYSKFRSQEDFVAVSSTFEPDK